MRHCMEIILRVCIDLTEICGAVLRRANEQLLLHYEYPQQKSLAYGADWCHDPILPYVATASFYDKLLHIWEPPVSVSKEP